MLQTRKNNRIGIGTILNRKQEKFLNFVEPIIDRFTGMTKIREMYEEKLAGKNENEFINGVISELHVNFLLSEEELSRIPKTGPVVVVANHPFGAHDAILMASLLSRVRPDYKIMANGFFSAIEELEQRLILVNAFKNNNPENHNPLRESVKFLKEQKGILGVFPSGTVSHYDFKKKCVTDPEWSETIAGIVKLSGATVIPVHFSGRNSLPFNLAGLVHPLLRTALLPREMLKEKGEIKVHIGHEIDNSYLCKMKSRKQITDYIRMRCYLLKEQNEVKMVGSLSHSVPIIPAISPEKLKEEISSLSSDDLMLDYKEYGVFCCSSSKIPYTMQEIGRLREVTFREVGEGTGKEIDTDKYDKNYLQLFVWNRETSEIVGAYRIGIVSSYEERKNLYTNEFYNLNREFFENYSPALEMGRSFVRKEYQRKPYPLMLLWRGICEYVARNPHYRYLFGAVSVSSEYSAKSRALMANLLIEKDKKLKSKMPAKIKLNGELKDYCRHYSIDDPLDISILVKEIEEDGKDVPVLIKQYMKLGGKFLSFCVDEEFNCTLDGLIVVDLPNAPEKNLKIYMAENTENYLKYHQNR